MTDSTPHAFEYPDEAGYPDGTGTLSQDQVVLIDEVDDPHAPAFAFTVVNDQEARVYEAIVGDREIGGLTYDVVKGADRLVLRATSIFPEFRGQGIATELIRQVLDDVRAQGKSVTIMCPIVSSFVDRNSEYADLVDAAHPGVIRAR